jgi:hypothetical protein
LFVLISDFSAQLLTILDSVVSLTGRQHEELLPQDVLGVNIFADVEGLLQVTLYHFDVLIEAFADELMSTCSLSHGTRYQSVEHVQVYHVLGGFFWLKGLAFIL